jgi:hypothetical protein
VPETEKGMTGTGAVSDPTGNSGPIRGGGNMADSNGKNHTRKTGEKNERMKKR